MGWACMQPKDLRERNEQPEQRCLKADSVQIRVYHSALERPSMTTTASLWIDRLLAPAALRPSCPVQLPVHSNGSEHGPWGLCCAIRFQASCVAASIGVGGEWTIEDALSQIGCRVNAFDPTSNLRASHTAHASSHERTRFHFLGLESPGEQDPPNRSSYGQLDRRHMANLSHLLAMATTGRASDRVDVLKIDCEGCEWPLFRWLAARQPALLSRVRVLMVELHVTPDHGFHNTTQLVQLLTHVYDHGFEIYRRKLNPGFKADKKQVPADLVAAHFPSFPCCIELHFVRRRDVDVPTRGGGSHRGQGGSERQCDFGIGQTAGNRIATDERLFQNTRLEQRYGHLVRGLHARTQEVAHIAPGEGGSR